MIAQILTLVGGLIALAGKLYDWLHERDLINGAKAQDHLEAATKRLEAIKSVIAAREAVRASAASDPDSVPVDDGFRRD